MADTGERMPFSPGTGRGPAVLPQQSERGFSYPPSFASGLPGGGFYGNACPPPLSYQGHLQMAGQDTPVLIYLHGFFEGPAWHYVVWRNLLFHGKRAASLSPEARRWWQDWLGYSGFFLPPPKHLGRLSGRGQGVLSLPERTIFPGHWATGGVDAKILGRPGHILAIDLDKTNKFHLEPASGESGNFNHKEHFCPGWPPDLAEVKPERLVVETFGQFAGNPLHPLCLLSARALPANSLSAPAFNGRKIARDHPDTGLKGKGAKDAIPGGYRSKHRGKGSRYSQQSLFGQWRQAFKNLFGWILLPEYDLEELGSLR